MAEPMKGGWAQRSEPRQIKAAPVRIAGICIQLPCPPRRLLCRARSQRAAFGLKLALRSFVAANLLVFIVEVLTALGIAG
jgi:hypothetical protein